MWTRRAQSLSRPAPVLTVLAALVAGVVGCLATVRGPYDTNQCYWTWVADSWGGYEQLHCWSPGVHAYAGYMDGGAYVRRYPSWYSGQRTVVVPPPVGLVRPHGVVIVPPPSGPRGPAVPYAVPSPGGGGPPPFHRGPHR